MALPSHKDIIELIKRGATIEAQEQIMELREAAVALQEENIELKNRVLEFRGVESPPGLLKQANRISSLGTWVVSGVSIAVLSAALPNLSWLPQNEAPPDGARGSAWARKRLV